MMDSLTLSPLSTASTDELIEELKRRADGGVIAFVQMRGGADHFLCDWWGGLTTAIGTAERVRARLVEVALSPSEEDDSEE